MRTLGVLGGMGPESTIDYYRSIIAVYQELTQDGTYPSLLINSIDVNRVFQLVAANALRDLTSYLSVGIESLANGGAELAIISANTPHVVFDAVASAAPIPLLSIVRATCEAAIAARLRRLALFGTRFVMTGAFYEAVFGPAGIQLVIPSPEEQAFIHEKYVTELVKGIFRPATRERLIAITEIMKEREGIEGVILAGTELPLLLRESSLSVAVLDTTQIHVKAAVAELLA